MADFTPGPWFLNEAADDRLEIVGHPTWPCKMNGVSGNWPVAVLDDFLGDHPAECQANARLIAAAPDLLAACEGLLERYRIMVAADGIECLVAISAIAKALGK